MDNHDETDRKTNGLHRVVGYDAREMYLPLETAWPARKRAEFLLKWSVKKPLSTDGIVWPSIFDTGEAPGFTPEERASQGLDGVALPDWIGKNHPLWEDLDDLREYILRTSPREPHWLIAVSLESDSAVEPFRAPLQEVSAPSWQFLGHDVADFSLLSGLSNCEYSLVELEELQATWKLRLNEYHLFSAVADAVKFCNATDQRVPEHAPFYVFGLWRIGEQ